MRRACLIWEVFLQSLELSWCAQHSIPFCPENLRKNKLSWKLERSSGSRWISFGCLAVLVQSRSLHRDMLLVSVHAKKRKIDFNSCKLQWDCQSGRTHSADNPSNGGFCRDAPAGWSILIVGLCSSPSHTSSARWKPRCSTHSQGLLIMTHSFCILF